MRVFIFSIIYCVVMTLQIQASKLPVDYVNVFTGTSNSRWMINPGPQMPFGMVKLGPDNQGNVWNGGYEYNVGSISGFSHLHGMSLSGVSYMPFTGNLYFGEEYSKLFPGNADGPFEKMWTSGYRSRYKKEDEKASVGYYSVKLYDYDIDVELTATNRCGLMRLTYPANKQSGLILDLDFPAEEQLWDVSTFVQKISDNEIAGSITQTNQYTGKYTVYFVSRFNKKIDTMDGWQWEAYNGQDTKYGTDWRRKCHLNKDLQNFSGKEKSGIVLNFSTNNGEKILVNTGISFVSIENARMNMEVELGAFQNDFDKVVENARSVWGELLSRVEIKSKNEDNISKFYTNFYRSFCGKNIFNDVNGDYLDMCGNLKKLEGNATHIFSGDAFWGAQWTLFPFWTLIAPEWANAHSNSLLSLQKQGGWIPQAPTALKYAPIMGAQHQNALLISSVQKGIANFDINQAYNAIKHDYTTPGVEHNCSGFAGNRHLKAYMDYGFVPEEVGPVSNTLEYAFDDWCMAQFSKKMRNRVDAKYFEKRAENYNNIFDPSTGYMRRKHADGKWYADFDPHREGTEGGWNGPGYMEGSAWIYTWFVPHNLPNLIKLLGEQNFNTRLEEGFIKEYVSLANQPNLQAPFLFNYSHKPWLTQKYSRYVLDKYFDLEPLSGWNGEEDEGQMGSLFCLFSMGLFEMTSGCDLEPYYDLSSPLFDEITIHLSSKNVGENKKFSIIAKNNSNDNVYIQKAMLNGKPMCAPKLKYGDIISGGQLILEMGQTPNDSIFRK